MAINPNISRPKILHAPTLKGIIGFFAFLPICVNNVQIFDNQNSYQYRTGILPCEKADLPHVRIAGLSIRPLMGARIRSAGVLHMNKAYQQQTDKRKFCLSLFAATAMASVLGSVRQAVAAAKISKQAVAYQETPKGNSKCGDCYLFAGPNACKNVDGEISPEGWCRLWSKKSS